MKTYIIIYVNKGEETVHITTSEKLTISGRIVKRYEFESNLQENTYFDIKMRDLLKTIDFESFKDIEKAIQKGIIPIGGVK